MNGYGFDVYFHINISNNLNLMIDSSTSVETKISDFLTPEVNVPNQNSKVDISAVKTHVIRDVGSGMPGESNILLFVIVLHTIYQLDDHQLLGLGLHINRHLPSRPT